MNWEENAKENAREIYRLNKRLQQAHKQLSIMTDLLQTKLTPLPAAPESNRDMVIQERRT